MPPPGRGRGRGHRGGRGGHRGHHHPHPHPQPAPPRPAPAHHHPHPHPVPVVHAQPKPAAKIFERLWHGADRAHVVVQHSLGKNLRVKPLNHHKLGYEGGNGELAHWRLHTHENGTVIQLQSMKTDKYLRMQPNGNDFDVDGVAKGPNTYFIVEKKSTGVFFLKTKKTYHNNQHAYVAVQHGNAAQKKLKIFIEGVPREWEKNYSFAKKNTVVIQHSGFKNLRADTSGGEGLDAAGGTGQWARFEAVPDHQNNTVTLRNVKTGGYIRIGPAGKLNCGGKGGKWCIFKIHHIGQDKNYVKLESLAHGGKFLAVRKDGPAVGVGGPFCALTFYRE